MIARTRVALILVAISVACIVGGVYAYMALSCPPHSHYGVVSERTTSAPTRFIIINQSDVQRYPLIGEVTDAFDNLSGHPRAWMHGNTLYYEFIEFDVGTGIPGRVASTTDYLEARFTEKYGRPPDMDLSFAYLETGPEPTYYYSWSILYVDEAWSRDCNHPR